MTQKKVFHKRLPGNMKLMLLMPIENMVVADVVSVSVMPVNIFVAIFWSLLSLLPWGLVVL